MLPPQLRLLPIQRNRWRIIARLPLLRLLWLIVGSGLPYLGWAADVAIIKAANIVPYQEAVAGFKEKFNGQITEYVLTPGKDIKDELELKVQKKQIHILFSLGTDALVLTKGYANNIPLVYAFVLDPDAVLTPLSTLERAHVTGVTMNIPAHAQFTELLKLRPKTQRVGVVYDPSRSQALVDDARRAARALGLTLVDRPIQSTAEAIDAYSALRDAAEVIWMVPDATAISPESLKFLMLFSLRNNLPVIGISDKYVKMGAFFALSFDARDMGRQAGELANRLLSDAPSTPLVAVAPRKFSISINLKSATSLGLNVPQEVLEAATMVYR